MQRTIRKTTYVLMAVTGICLLLLPQWRTHSQTLGPTCTKDVATPLAGLTAEQATNFFFGCDDFMEVETIEDGLGPVFNGKSCAECHAVPRVGGGEPNLGVARETRIGRLVKVNGVDRFDPLDGSVSGLDRGGPLLQQRAINLQGCQHLKGEVVPPEATIVSLRLSTPLFGAGLIEAIPEGTILKNAKPPDGPKPDGGKPNYVSNPDPGDSRTLGRFGWKAQ